MGRLIKCAIIDWNEIETARRFFSLAGFGYLPEVEFSSIDKKMENMSGYNFGFIDRDKLVVSGNDLKNIKYYPIVDGIVRLSEWYFNSNQTL